MSNTIFGWIFLEITIIIGGILFINHLQKKKTRQPSLSNKIIKNLKL